MDSGKLESWAAVVEHFRKAGTFLSGCCFSSYLNKTHWLLIGMYIEFTIKDNGPISAWHCLPLGDNKLCGLGFGEIFRDLDGS